MSNIHSNLITYYNNNNNTLWQITKSELFKLAKDYLYILEGMFDVT